MRDADPGRGRPRRARARAGRGPRLSARFGARGPRPGLVACLHCGAVMRPTRRLAPPALAALTLSACALSFPVELVRELDLVVPAGDAALEVPVDLAEDAAIWKHRDAVEAYSVEAVSARVLSVGPSNEAAVVDVDLSLRADGGPEDGSEDVLVARVKELPLEEGARVELDGTRKLEQLLLDALRRTGRFTAVVRTRADHAVDALLELRITGAVEYDLVERP